MENSLRGSHISGQSSHADGGRHTCAVLSVLAVSWAPVMFGMSLGFSSPALDVMQDSVKVDGNIIKSPDHLVVFRNESEGAIWGSIINIGGFLGALIGGPISEKMGRKLAILFLAPVFLGAWVLTGMFSSFVTLLVCRLVGGLAIGITSGVVPTYINEIAPASLRGACGAVFQTGVVTGIMFSYLFGAYIFLESTSEHDFCQWRHLAFFFIVPSTALGLCAVIVPESPSWLASRGKPERSFANLRRLRGNPATAAAEVNVLARSSNNAAASGGFKDIVKNRHIVSIGFTLMLLQQLSGVNVIILYADSIFQAAGFQGSAQLGFFVMLVQLVMTAISIPLIDTAGRKTLLLLSTAGMLVCCIGMLTFFIHLQPAWLAMVASFGYISFFSLGLGPIPWLMQGELFSQEYRSLAMSCSASLNWLCSCLTTSTVAALQSAVGFTGVFAIYGAVLLMGILYILRTVPETKGRSLEEIQEILGNRQCARLTTPSAQVLL